jgi:hypothetical protein
MFRKKQFNTPAQELTRKIINFLVNDDIISMVSLNPQQIKYLTELKKNKELIKTLKRLNKSDVAEKVIYKLNFYNTLIRVLNESQLSYDEIRKITAKFDEIYEFVYLYSADDMRREITKYVNSKKKKQNEYKDENQETEYLQDSYQMNTGKKREPDRDSRLLYAYQSIQDQRRKTQTRRNQEPGPRENDDHMVVDIMEGGVMEDRIIDGGIIVERDVRPIERVNDIPIKKDSTYQRNDTPIPIMEDGITEVLPSNPKIVPENEECKKYEKYAIYKDKDKEYDKFICNSLKQSSPKSLPNSLTPIKLSKFVYIAIQNDIKYEDTSDQQKIDKYLDDLEPVLDPAKIYIIYIYAVAKNWVNEHKHRYVDMDKLKKLYKLPQIDYSGVIIGYDKKSLPKMKFPSSSKDKEVELKFSLPLTFSQSPEELNFGEYKTQEYFDFIESTTTTDSPVPVPEWLTRTPKTNNVSIVSIGPLDDILVPEIFDEINKYVRKNGYLKSINDEQIPLNLEDQGMYHIFYIVFNNFNTKGKQILHSTSFRDNENIKKLNLYKILTINPFTRLFKRKYINGKEENKILVEFFLVSY